MEQLTMVSMWERSKTLHFGVLTSQKLDARHLSLPVVRGSTPNRNVFSLNWSPASLTGRLFIRTKCANGN